MAEHCLDAGHTVRMLFVKIWKEAEAKLRLVEYGIAGAPR